MIDKHTRLVKMGSIEHIDEFRVKVSMSGDQQVLLRNIAFLNHQVLVPLHRHLV